MIRLRVLCRLVAAAAVAVGISAAPAVAKQVLAASPVSQEQHVGHTALPVFFTPRDTSGTAWLPDETPMYGVQLRAGPWAVMLHGAVFGQWLYEPDDPHRTGGFESQQASSVNWFMAMARRPAGAGWLGLRGMVSLEPWTVRNCGFINALANGEMCDGDTIHDRQHPHDLFMELAAEYDRPIRGSVRWQVYAGVAGEPALGPPGFPHRVSAAPNPVAPISHHWLDSSHITFGLVTAGLYDRRWKIEASAFNGREPDEERADIDFGPLDSVSGRITFLPTNRWALQVSAGHLHEAEAEFSPQPRSDVERATASATYHRMTPTTVWATTVAYGVNASQEVIPGAVVDVTTHAALVESQVSVRDRHTLFGRIEIVGKAGHDLHIHSDPAGIFTVGKLQAGYVRYFGAWKGLTPGVGGTASLGLVPQALAPRYLGQVTPGFGVFFTVRPARHAM